MQLPSLIIQALALPTMALALGINCRGSFLCHGNESPIVSRIQNLVTGAVNRGAGGNFYSEGSTYPPTEWKRYPSLRSY